MTTTTPLLRSIGLATAAVMATATALVIGIPTSQAANTTEGMLCDTTGDNGVYNLDATSGYVSTPDGNSIYMWSYADSGRPFQLPGPVLCATTGATVTVVLHNQLPEATSIVFSGQTGVTADGAPAQPQYATPGDPTSALTSLVQGANAKSGTTVDTVTYSFTAGAPGTYLYSSGSDVTKQRQMGLYGALVVYPSGHSPSDVTTQANDRAATTFSAAHEYLFLLSEVDPALHLAVERNRTFDFSTLTPRYFFMNGRSMPDTLAPNNAAWLPSQPYGSTVHVTPNSASNPLPSLIRYLNAGSVNFPFHPHGSDELVVTRDGAPVSDTAGADASYEKFLIDAGPGQSVDALLTWKNEYDPNGSAGTTCSDPNRCDSIPADVHLPQLQDQIVGPGTETWFSENPYLGAPGGKGPIPNQMIQNNECGEFYQIAHSHALQQATNYGAAFGGMMTLFRIDPAGQAGCTK